ncbi:site-specific DNA-methyltransferase [uncultured Tenacibaculum sp.]|uniref:site-specific DNA-methyltransferase n=1 Tax=uncultured Tenacibaculum sp. TaxID=174713 RepID=UPI0026343589|nr:site-specific DNA-methyltransferase [uncultured Tenacibaculum sp.]
MRTDKLDLTTPDLVNQNIEKIAALFPNCVTETAEGKAIDFDTLKQELNYEVVEGAKERYRLEWPGKKEAIVTANLPTTKTLRPVREDSVDFDTTENLYIEGDNLEVLKILQESYLGKIKMIYIDPPYNTGKDFVYKDNFTQDSADYKEETDQTDEYGNRLVANPETAGRYHSDWLSMMYPRLKLARNLLTDDGVIFMSIGEEEVANLKSICSNIFGEANFISNIIWQSRTSISNDQNVSLNHNHTLIYSKSNFNVKFGGEPLNQSEYSNPDNDKRGPWKLVPIDANKAGGDTMYAIKNPKTNEEFYPPNGRIWAINEKTYKSLFDDGRIKFGKTDDSSPKKKLFLKERLDKGDVKTPSSILLKGGTTKDGTNEIMDLFDGKKVFSYPKPSLLIEKLLNYGGAKDNDIILDFFSGSASSAHSVLSLNAKDGFKRKFIMVQLPEDLEKSKLNADSASKKAIETAMDFLEKDKKPKLLTEIGKERIRRAAAKIKEETKADIDYGFKVFKVASSNMQEVYYKPQDYNQGQLDVFADNIKEDRTSEDLLTQILLDWGLPLTLKTQKETVLGKEVFVVDTNYLLACFDKDLDEAFAKEIAKHQPLRFVCKDSSFKNDTAKENVKQLLKQLSPNTEMKVI